MIVVRGHAIPVKPAEIKIADLLFFVGRESVGVTHRENSHVRVDGHPAVRSDINLGPVVDGFVAGAGVPAGLPAGGNSVETAECDEEKSFLSAITVLFGAAIVADVADGGVFDGVAVFDLVANP